jgi:hypothetical protein
MFVFANKQKSAVALLSRLGARAITTGCDRTLTSITVDSARMGDAESEIAILRREGTRGYICSAIPPIPVVGLRRR